MPLSLCHGSIGAPFPLPLVPNGLMEVSSAHCRHPPSFSFRSGFVWRGRPLRLAIDGGHQKASCVYYCAVVLVTEKSLMHGSHRSVGEQRGTLPFRNGPATDDAFPPPPLALPGLLCSWPFVRCPSLSSSCHSSLFVCLLCVRKLLLLLLSGNGRRQIGPTRKLCRQKRKEKTASREKGMLKR